MKFTIDILAIATAVGALMVIGGFIGKLFFPIKKILNKIDATQKAVEATQETLNEQGICDAQLSAYIEELRSSQQLMENSLISMLREKIKTRCMKCKSRGYMRLYEWETICDLFASYEALGGNGTIKQLYADTKDLPIREEKES